MQLNFKISKLNLLPLIIPFWPQLRLAYPACRGEQDARSIDDRDTAEIQLKIQLKFSVSAEISVKFQLKFSV